MSENASYTDRWQWVAIAAIVLMLLCGAVSLFLYIRSIDVQTAPELERQMQEQINAQATQIALLQQTPTATPFQPVTPTATPTQPPTASPTPESTPTATASETSGECPTEREFTKLLGGPEGFSVDIVPTEACTFYWRGYPNSVVLKNACPLGTICTIDVPVNDEVHTTVFVGESDMEQELFGATWRVVNAFPADDAVHDACAFFEKVKHDGETNDPLWTAYQGNIDCP